MAIYKVASAEQSLSGITPPSPYFYSSLTSVDTGDSTKYSNRKIVTDANKNIIVLYSRADSNGSGVAKYDQYGALIWLFGYKDAQSYYSLNGMDIDSSGNIYVVGTTYQSYYPRPHIIKLNSSGSIVWQKQFGDGSQSNGGGLNAVTIDSSGNIYAAGYAHYSDTDARPYIVKYDSSGAKSWDYRYSGVSNAGFFNNISIDSSGNIWASGTSYSGGNANTDAFVIKVDSSGNELLQRTLSEGTNIGQTIEKMAMVIDSSSNVYFLAQSSSGGVDYGVLIKINSSGTLQWQRKISSSGNSQPRGLGFATDGNLVSVHSATGYGQGVVVHNPSGTLQWQKRLIMKNGGLSTGIEAFNVDSFGNMCLGISTSGLVATNFTENGLVKIPVSSVASYSSSLLKMALQYTTGSLTDGAGGLTNTTSTITRSSSIPLTSSNSVSSAYTINNSISKVAL